MVTVTTATSADWWARAACSGQDTRDWFRMGTPAPQTLTTCRSCLVRAECLHDALTHETPNGIWGGLTPVQRRRIPALPRVPRAEAIGRLRTLLTRLDSELAERTTPMAQPVPATPDDAPLKAVPAPTPVVLPVDKLLDWGDTHVDPDVQAQAARARAALTGLRNRYASDLELNQITSEEEKLAARLTELRTRKAELLPAKAKSKGKRKASDYPAAEVRAWAKANGHEVSPTGRVPKDVVDAWRTATGHTGAGDS